MFRHWRRLRAVDGEVTWWEWLIWSVACSLGLALIVMGRLTKKHPRPNWHNELDHVKIVSLPHDWADEDEWI